MNDVIPTVLAGVAVFLFAGGLIALTAGEIRIASVSFFSASLVIYFRETRFDTE